MPSTDKVFPDYEIISALLDTNSITEAAAKLGCDRSTIYRAMERESWADSWRIALSVASRQTNARTIKLQEKALAIYEKLLDPDCVRKPTKVELAAANQMMRYGYRAAELDVVEAAWEKYGGSQGSKGVRP